MKTQPCESCGGLGEIPVALDPNDLSHIMTDKAAETLSDPGDEVAVSFDHWEWAEIAAALKMYKETIDPGKARNSFVDVCRIMSKIDPDARAVLLPTRKDFVLAE